MRVVSLVPSLTQTILDLGRGIDLVGITDYCPEVMGTKTVGGPKTVDLQAVRKLKPDLIVMCEEENDKKQGQALMKDFETYVDKTTTVNDAIETVLNLAELLGAKEAASMWEESCHQALSQVEAKIAGRKPKKVAYLVWNDPLMSVNGKTYIGDMLKTVGFENVLEDQKTRYPKTTLGALEKAGTELYLLPNEPFEWTEEHLREFPDGKGRLVVGEHFCWHGTWLLKGLRGFLANKWEREP